MKTYNKTITIEVSVDTIAKRLLDNMKDSPIAESVVEAIIGTSLANKSGIDKIYNALCGFDNSLTYQVGDEIGVWDELVYISNRHDTLQTDFMRAKITEIDEYAKKPIVICVEYINSKGVKDEHIQSIQLEAVTTLDNCGTWDAALAALRNPEPLFNS